MDSVVLLHLLTRLAPRYGWHLRALHVHHGLSGHADAWRDFCSGLCAEYRVPLDVEPVDIAPVRHLGIEAAARQLRYAALNRQPVDFVVLAHHRDDQVETLLLQLLRGAGVRGAAAMPVCKSKRNVPAVLRPLLDVTRAELFAYASTYQLRWVEDESNGDERYLRNYLRHKILPEIEASFPAYRAALARSAGHFAEASDLLDELAALDARTAIVGQSLDIAVLRALSLPRGKNLLRYFLSGQGALLPDSTRLREMWSQLCAAEPGKNIKITWQNYALRAYRGYAHLLRDAPAAADWECVWQGEHALTLPGGVGTLHFERVIGKGVSLAKLTGGRVTVRPRRAGDGGVRRADGHRQSLKNLFQHHAVPPWQREIMPLVFDAASTLIAVPGLAVAHAYRAGEGEAGVELSWDYSG